MRDSTEFLNNEQLEETLQFAENTKMPDFLVYKIRYYYSEMKSQFEELESNQKLMLELPIAI
jgi:hypothetical protein